MKLKTIGLAIPLVAFLPAVTGCELLTGSGGSDDSDGEEGEGEGEGEGEPGGWTQLVLTNDPDETALVDHGGVFGNNADDVTAIYFESLSRGYVGTDGTGGVGALYRARAGAIEAKLLADTAFRDPAGALGEFGIRSIIKTTTGFIATMDQCGSVMASTDGGGTFAVTETGLGPDYGLAGLHSLTSDANDEWTAIVGAAVATANEAPSATTSWTEVWGPEGVPPTPNPVPANGCPYSPTDREVDQLSSWSYISPDRQTVAYAPRSQEAEQDVVCISHDGGALFLAANLPHFNGDANVIGATSVMFIDRQVGFVTTSDGLFGAGGSASIQKTTNGGLTWSRMPLPASVTSGKVIFRAVFFAPDNTTGWAVGSDEDESVPLILKTEDGGDTWRLAGATADLAAKIDSALTNNFGRLMTGFALDEDNIWVGGDHSAVFYSANGGD